MSFDSGICFTLDTRRQHDRQLKSLGKIQRAGLGIFGCASTQQPHSLLARSVRWHQQTLKHAGVLECVEGDRGGQGDSKELLAGHHHPNDARAPGLSD